MTPTCYRDQASLCCPHRWVVLTYHNVDIRTLYILLVLSFLDTTTPSSVKGAFLEQHRDAFTLIFKGLWQDPYSVIRRVLEVCWSGLWSDAKLKRTLKIQVFSEATLSQVRALQLCVSLPACSRLHAAAALI